MKRCNGFYLGASIGFLGYLIQQTSSAAGDLAILQLFIECSMFALLSGGLFLLGVFALSGRGHADNINSQAYDHQIRAQCKKEIASDVDKTK